MEQINTYPDKYTVLAADLSLKRPGFSIISFDMNRKKNKIKVIHTTSVDNKKAAKPRGEILVEIKAMLDGILKKYHPDFFVREKAINSRGAMSEIGIFEVVGLTDYWLWNLKKTWAEIYPVTVKKQITGNGRADKEQVASVLPRYVGPIAYANDDESDATAVGIAWLIQEGQLQQISLGGTTNEEEKHGIHSHGSTRAPERTDRRSTKRSSARSRSGKLLQTGEGSEDLS